MKRPLIYILFILFACLSASAQTAESDSLFAKGVRLFRAGRYNDCIKVFSRVEKLDSAYFGLSASPGSPIKSRAGYAPMWRASAMYRSGRQQEAMELAGDDAAEEPVDRALTAKIDEYVDMAIEAQQRGSLSMAGMYVEWVIDEEKKVLGPTHWFVANSLLERARLHAAVHEYSQAEMCALQAFGIFKSGGNNVRGYLDPLIKYYRAAGEMGRSRFDEAMVLAREAFRTVRPFVRTAAQVYGEVVTLYFSLCQYKGTIDEFVEAAMAVKDDCLSDGKRLNEQMVYSLWSALASLVDMQLFDPAIELAEASMKRVSDDGLDNSLAASYIGVYYAKILNEVGRYEEALPLADKSIATARLLNSPESMSLGQTYETKARAEAGLGRYPQALATVEQAISEFLKLSPYVDPGLWRSYSIKAGVLSKMKRYEEAGKALKQVKDALKSIRSENWVDWAYISMQETSIYVEAGNYAEARKSIDRALDYYRKISVYKDIPAYYQTLVSKIEYGLTDGAADTEAIFDEILTRMSESDELAQSQGPLMKVKRADYLYFNNRAEEAEEIFNRLIADGVELGDHRVVYAKILLRRGKSQKAIEVIERYFALLEQRFGERSLYRAAMMVSAATALASELPVKALEYANMGHKALAAEPWSTDKMLAMKQLSAIYTNLSPREDCLAVTEDCLANIAPDSYMEIAEMQLTRSGCLVNMGRLGEAREALTRAKEAFVKAGFPDTDSQHAYTLGEAFCLEAEGLYGEAIEALRKTDRSMMALPPSPTKTESRVNVNMRIINLIPKTGRMEMMNEATDTLMRLMRDNYDSNNPMYALVYQYQANRLAAEGKVDEGYKILRDAVDRYTASSPDANVATTLRQWAVNYLLLTGRRSEGLVQADSLIESARRTRSLLHPAGLIEMARAASVIGNYDKADAYLDMIHSGMAQTVSDKYVALMENAIRAEAAMGRKEIDKGYKHLLSTYEGTQKLVLDNFLTMSETERRDLWNSVLVLFRNNIPLAAYMSDFDPRFNALAYDAALFSTSLLLQSTKTVDDVVSTEKDRKLKRLVKQFDEARARYDAAAIKARTSVGGDATAGVEALRAEKEAAEKELLKSLKNKLGSYNAGLAVKWTDVRDALGSDEAAVEFVEQSFTDSLRSYYAIVLRPGYESPHMIFLPFASALDLRSEECYTTEKVYNDLWHPLADELKGCRRVWFAPQGQLTASAIESVPGLEKLTGVEGTVYCRLTSTREIAVKERKAGRGAVLYGGIDYAAGSDAIVDDARRYGPRKRSASPVEASFAGGLRDIDFRAIADTDARKLAADSVRDVFVGIRPLPGTLSEMNATAPILRSGAFGNNVKPLSGVKATEASLKALSGEGKRLLHIGTHGFYYDGTRTAWAGFFGDASLPAEEMAMHRSGLLFAGAQGPLCRGLKMPDDVDDGVLTAAEIASLDFSGMELTVLSACETALGRISADGVFGLQRGFKQAGARAMLMSLWKVDDNATAALMTHFYSEWLKGADKYAALESAKRHVASRPEWKSPDYWAAFILVDGF